MVSPPPIKSRKVSLLKYLMGYIIRWQFVQHFLCLSVHYTLPCFSRTTTAIFRLHVQDRLQSLTRYLFRDRYLSRLTHYFSRGYGINIIIILSWKQILCAFNFIQKEKKWRILVREILTHHFVWRVRKMTITQQTTLIWQFDGKRGTTHLALVGDVSVRM